MVRKRAKEDIGNLWLAKALWDMGAVQFGDFTMGRTTVHSPIYVNARLLVSNPAVLRRAAKVMALETTYELAKRKPSVSPFQLVAGVPMGGLHLATAFSLLTKMPMVYAYARPMGQNGGSHVIEGKFQPGQTVLIIDDLITTGGSILETAELLQDAGLIVKDSFVLIDREEGGVERLRYHGYNLRSILSLSVMLNYYLSTGRTDEAHHRKCVEYIRANRHLYRYGDSASPI